MPTAAKNLKLKIHKTKQKTTPVPNQMSTPKIRYISILKYIKKRRHNVEF